MQKESQVVEIRPEDIVLEQEIGRGSFAKVHRGKCRGQTVAIKVLHTQTFTEQVLEAFREEIAVMSQIHHPNRALPSSPGVIIPGISCDDLIYNLIAVLFMGACTIPGKLMIVTELMPRNLESVFLGKTGKHKRVALVQKLKMAKDAALGMNWLHKSTPMFIHRDFKLSNLLVDENYNVKVCDFGLTKMKQANDSLHDTKGSPLYMAPEVFTGSYSEKCDVYSFGLSFWEIINERRVFPRYENNLEALIKSRCENYETPPITDDMLPRLVSLLQRCWDKNPNLRPPFDVVVKELEEIIIEQCITDERGRDVWKKASKGEDKMTWDKLARAVCISVGKVALPESYRSDRQMQCLKVLLCRQSEPNMVHAEKFGKVLAWFGPYSDGPASSRGRTFLDRIEETLSMKWFHGELSTQDAEERLDNRRPGTFLVRFSSSEKGAFTVSGVDKDRKKSHQRVVYHPHKGFYVMPDDTINYSLIDAINDLCRASKLRNPCPGSRYAKYFSEEPQPTSKNIALVKEEIKQLQLIHLNEICEVPDKDTSLDTTIDTASAGRPWGSHHPHHHQSGSLDGQRSPFHTGNIHSSGTWGNGGGIMSGLLGNNAGGDSDSEKSSIRIAPYIPPAHSVASGNMPSPYHAGGPGGHHSSGPSYHAGGPGGHHSSGPSSSASISSASTIHAALAANKAAATAAAAMSYRQSPYTHASTTHASMQASKYPSLTYSPHPLNSAELYYSAPMTGMKNTSSSSFSFSQFASTKHPFRSKDVLTAPLKSEEKKRGLFSRLKRGVTGKDKDKDNYRDRDDGSDLSDSSVSSTWSGKSGKLSTKVNNNNSGGKKSAKKEKKNNSLGKKGHGRDRDHYYKDDKDFNGDDPHGYHRGTGGDNGGGTSDDDSMGMYATPYVPSVATDSTTASTNSIPAHVLHTLQKAEDERMRKRINGNYDSDSSTEDLFPPYQPSSATSATSSYIKRTIEEKARHLQHLVGGREMEEEEEVEDRRDEDAEGEAERDGSEDDGEDEDESDEEGEKRQKKSKAKESSRARKEDKERRRREKSVATSTADKQQKAERSERRKERAALKEATTTTTTAADDALKEKKRTKPTINIPVAVITRPAPASSSNAPMSLASTAPPGMMEAALLNAPRPRRERKPEHRSSSRKAADQAQANGNGRVAGEEEGLRLDQVVAKTSTTPSPREALVLGALGNLKESTTKHAGKREKKGRGGDDADGSTGDEAETVSASSVKKEKKSKKEKSSKGVKDAMQRRQPPASRATTSASSDMTGGEDEDETSEKEQNDPQGKKKKNKDEERTVIAVF